MPDQEQPVTLKRSLSYPFSALPLGVVDVELLKAELASSSLSVQPSHVQGRPLPTLVIGFAQPISLADKAVVDGAVAAHQAGTTALVLAKADKVKAIDGKTTSCLVGATFTYSGKQFSLSPIAQFNTLVMYMRRNEAGFSYPVVRSTKDSSSSVSLADAAAVETFYVASESTVRAVLDAGNALKDQVNAAQSIEAIAAVVDNR